jgi:hypothetical protein
MGFDSSPLVVVVWWCGGVVVVGWLVWLVGREGGIRTRDLSVPNAAR